MEQNKKTVSTSTVLIAIAFLAMFIILPPVTRVLYAEESSDGSEGIVNQSSDEGNKSGEMTIQYTSMVCTKEYTNVPLMISSTSTFSGRKILTNEVTFENSTIITDPSTLEDPIAQVQAVEYFTVLNTFQEIDEDYLSVSDTITVATINQEVANTFTNDSMLIFHYQDKTTLKMYYEENGYTCVEQ